jgi:protein ImuB
MTRVVAVCCADWAAAAAAHRQDAGDGPVAVLRANRVVAVNVVARRAGVHVGQRRRDAQRSCPDLLLSAYDPVADAQAFEPVLRALGTVVARVEVVRPGWCTVPARSAARYHGGDGPLVARLRDTVAGATPVAVEPRIAVADGRFSALVLAARAGVEPVVVPPGRSADALATLPVAVFLDALDVDDPDRSAWQGVVGLLVRLGLPTLGAVAALPAADLVARFGPIGERIHRWATGTDDRPPVASSPPPERIEVLELDPPVTTAEPVAFAVRGVAEALCGRLAAGGSSCTEIQIRLESEHGERNDRRWRRELGFNASAVTERVRWQLEGWATGPTAPTAGIIAVRLVATEVVADIGQQDGFWGGRTQADLRAARTVARLVGLLGPEAVTVPEWRGGRDPAEAVVLVPAATVELAERAAAVGPRPGDGPWPGALPAPAPTWIAPAPVPVQVLDPAGEPVGVTGRGMLTASPDRLVGEHRPPVAVVDHAGPWPLEERWWDPQRHRRRARLQLLLADGTACLVVREHGAWWLAGIHD